MGDTEVSAEMQPPLTSDYVDVISPTVDDPVIAANSDTVGGPIGPRATSGFGYWTAAKVVVIMAAAGFCVGLASKLPCTSSGWADPGRYTHLCYSDIPPLFTARGFADHVFPYISNPLPGQEQLEYPVLTGLFMQVANWLTPRSGNVMLWFYYINAIMLAVCLIITVIATAATVRKRPWDAAMVALAPGTILSAVINWDLLAVALTSISLMLWARKQPVAAGVLLGLAAAAKFYPLMLLGGLLLLCLRAGRMKAFGLCVAAVLWAWLVVNVPFMLINWDGWFRFYKFSSVRGEDFGSLWLVLTNTNMHVPPEKLNAIATGLFVLLCVGIAVLALAVQRRPRLGHLCFLIVAAFLITNKVYSPQYVLWLIPLAVLARPRWRDFLIWQAGEVIYFIAIWWYLAGLGGGDTKGLPVGWYSVAVMVHIIATLYFAGMVIRDVIWPQHDPIRTDGHIENADDPGGGVLDGAPDNARFRRLRSAER